MRGSLNDPGKVIVVDLGFNPSWIEEIAEKFFPFVHVEKMTGICCECSGMSAELFIASMTT